MYFVVSVVLWGQLRDSSITISKCTKNGNSYGIFNVNIGKKREKDSKHLKFVVAHVRVGVFQADIRSRPSLNPLASGLPSLDKYTNPLSCLLGVGRPRFYSFWE